MRSRSRSRNLTSRSSSSRRTKNEHARQPNMEPASLLIAPFCIPPLASLFHVAPRCCVCHDLSSATPLLFLEAETYSGNPEKRCELSPSSPALRSNSLQREPAASLSMQRRGATITVSGVCRTMSDESDPEMQNNRGGRARSRVRGRAREGCHARLYFSARRICDPAALSNEFCVTSPTLSTALSS